MTNLRIGNGFDVHKFSSNRKLVLGGVEIDSEYGLEGHSDADVLVHSIIDSIVSPAGLGDIGQLFPDTDAHYKNISSIKLLENVFKELNQRNISLINIDATIICEKPKVSPYISEMKKNISEVLNGLPIERITIKGTTTEKLGFTGREEGIAVLTTSLIQV